MKAHLYLAAAALFFLPAPAIEPLCAAVTAPPPIPAPPAENMPRPPVTAEPMAWQPGHWDWNGSRYEWASGQWVPSAGHGNIWVPGSWRRLPEGWEWQPAHWRR